jgi:flagellar motility protein MotE (MotC chaperone)
VNKKLIIITGIIGLASFAGMFLFAWSSKRSTESLSSEVVQPAVTSEEPPKELPEPLISPTSTEMSPTSTESTGERRMKKAMTEKQLKSLVYEVREKIQEYDSKLKDLKVHEQRLQEVEDMLKKDVEQLDNLRVELASTVVHLKTERDKLLKSRVEIAKKEKNNLMSIAATYDKMDSEAAGKILVKMNQAQNDSANDAVKILFYMSERAKAKVLACLAETESNRCYCSGRRLAVVFACSFDGNNHGWDALCYNDTFFTTTVFGDIFHNQENHCI